MESQETPALTTREPSPQRRRDPSRPVSACPAGEAPRRADLHGMPDPPLGTSHMVSARQLRRMFPLQGQLRPAALFQVPVFQMRPTVGAGASEEKGLDQVTQPPALTPHLLPPAPDPGGLGMAWQTAEGEIAECAGPWCQQDRLLQAEEWAG